jgi:hypothetical protein
MEQNRIHMPPASADQPAFVPTMVSPSLNDTFDRAPDPQPRRIRHDGWTPERQAVFLDALAACGVVGDAAKRAGMSAQSAYALRNRRAGRAFATAWDAVLVNRARGRLGDELMSRAMNGCVEAIHRDGAVVGERHRYDNRLSMAVLTRLDRLAEATTSSAEHLRAVSEDLDDFLDCLEAGGDADAFIEARRPRPPAEQAPDRPRGSEPPAAEQEPHEGKGGRDWDVLDSLLGTNYRNADPFDLDISDLPAEDLSGCSLDQYLRAHYTGYLTWLEVCRADERERADSGEIDDELGTARDEEASPAHYKRRLRAARARIERDRARRAGAAQPSTSSTSRATAPIEPGPDPADMRAECSSSLRPSSPAWSPPAASSP